MSRRGPGTKPYLELPGPWLVAHRGGALLAPENTLAAFDRAASLGADAIETDVRLSADGTVVIFHDDETSRITGDPGTVEARTLDEIARLDAGARFTPDGGRTFPYRGAGERIPTLEEALARHPGMRFNVEAKAADPRLAAALVAVVREAKAIDRVCLGSSDDGQGERIRSLLPEACHFLPAGAATCHVLAARSGGEATGCPEGWEVADLPVRTDQGLWVVDGAVAGWFRARGMAVFVWTVDEEADMRRLLDLGVHGVMTDRPDRLARLLGRRV
ncbi:MAG TPA: glycerophosphodiester phosphodiesterase [Anaeromyxobacteraceae bacterium]|nr:glycerophosphodiester phosphodiesterase [Anaeromyxobacteraceae bacterium]